ncbi:hypothetical protein BSKO_03617 [Bryopsis sp. KO-2023]|nr:hypothetical protein BSKO_03617 [Bryopsis sp. KO-2023]
MHTWLCACVDERIKVAAPMIGVQSFGWAVRNDQFHARVASIPQVFNAAAGSMQKSEVDHEVVAAVWAKILPGLLDFYDAPISLPSLAPLPLLVVNGELDERCPVEGLESVFEKTKKEYAWHGAGDSFSVRIEKDVGHVATPDMKAAVLQWFDHHLLEGSVPEKD